MKTLSPTDPLRPVLLLAVLAAACSPPPPKPTPNPTPSADPGAPPVIDRVTPLPSPLPDIVARVNGQPVHVEQVLGLARKALEGSNQREKDMPGAVRQAMHQYVVRELLFQEAMARGVVADTKRVEAVYDQVRAGFKDEERFKESLRDQGLDPQAYKQELRVQETVNALLAKVAEPVTVGDEEAKAFFAAHPRAIDPGELLEVRQILFRVPPSATNQVKEGIRVKAAVAANRAARGEDFTKLVQELSQDPKARENGGVMEVRRGKVPPAFEQAAYALQPGQVSGIVETPTGFSVIKLETRVPGPPVAFEDVKDRVKEEVLKEKRQATYQSLVNSLRAKARIETYL